MRITTARPSKCRTLSRPRKFEPVSQPCRSCHAKENAIGCPFGESLTDNASPREPRWVFDDAQVYGSCGFAVAMRSNSASLSENRSNSMKPSAGPKPRSFELVSRQAIPRPWQYRSSSRGHAEHRWRQLLEQRAAYPIEFGSRTLSCKKAQPK